jgi:predicted transcriptional regulator YdeE
MPEFSISESIVINKDPETVFDAVADFGTWSTWSPWLLAEPDAKVTVSPDPASVGSTYDWDGKVVGAGGLVHQKLERGQRIEAVIQFLRPMKSKSMVYFDFDAAEGGTKITWHMEGSMPFYLGWLIPMIRTFVAMDYNRGLMMLKEWLETGEIATSEEIVGLTSSPSFRLAGIRTTCSVSEIAASMQNVMQETKERLDAAGICPEGAGASAYYHFDVKAGTFDYISGFIVPADTRLPDGLTEWSTPEDQTFSVIHTGPYSHLGNAWYCAYQHVRNAGLPVKQKKTPTFEIYRNDPETTDPADLITQIYVPVRKKIMGFF